MMRPGPQPADTFSEGKNYCNLLLYLKTKFIFENWKGAISLLPAAGPLPAGRVGAKHCDQQNLAKPDKGDT